ncbi:hypothetical protein [Gulosibacter molinativorax]|uniref:Dihydrodipicolinate reductase n=1 Tax=Gulosibacter molinativorax TaxID=256821 RepID=A0ABT7CAN4_9MICO|nr:hypothetical protein [Gulosibacter molinativorax]MDJ1372262.1 hypothetical protein [Gulosibacter molinativorax]QUY63453.1 Hypotetical protein [Gulosibacter molinativorax]
MTTTIQPHPDYYRVVTVGIGAQGARIAELLHHVGHEILGAVDIGDKVGKPLAEFIEGEDVPDVAVTEDLFTLLDGLETKPEIVVLTPALSLERILDMAGQVLDRGINVITLQQDVLSRDDSWATGMHERAVRGGASFMASGVQDTWWVQLPALVSASSLDITTVRLTSEISLQALSAGVGEEIGVPLSAEEFAAHTEATKDVPSVLGAPMVEAARRMGAVAGPVSKETVPIFADATYEWGLAGTTIQPGQTCGFVETLSFETDRGIRFEGIVTVQPIEQDESKDSLDVIGMPTHHLEYRPFPSYEITNVALISRIPDVVNAEPGMLFSAEMPVASHQFTRR